MSGWHLVYTVLWDVLFFGCIAWLIFGGGLRKIMGIGAPSSLPSTSPTKGAAADYPEFRDRDRR